MLFINKTQNPNNDMVSIA